ncbi:hypothetical protein [Streptomyces sp. NPDC002324]
MCPRTAPEHLTGRRRAGSVYAVSLTGEDAEREKDTEVAELFRTAQADSRKGADLGKRLLHRRLSD